MLIFFFFGGIAPIGLISGIALLVLFVAAESLLLGHLAGIGLLKVTFLMFTGWLIYAGWTFLGHPPSSTSPYTLISIRFVLFATETVFLWSCTSWLVGLVPVSLLLGVPDDEVPFARLLDRNVRLLILLPFVPIILAHAIGLPPRFSPWYALPLTLIYIVWICLCQSTRKRWLCVWALLLFFTMFISPFAATYLQARAVFLAFPSIVELNPSLDGCAGPALFAHISDIHAVAGATRTFDGDVPGNTRLPRLLDAIASTRPAYLLVTGDVTDRGRVSEWETVLELLKPAAERIKVILAPGNHDLSGFFSELPSLGEAPRVEEFIRQQHSLFNGINDSAGASLAKSFDNAPSRESPQYNNAQKAVRACYTNCQPQLSLNEEQWQIIKRHSADIERILRIENPLASQCFYRCQHSKAQEEIDYVDDYWKQYGESAFPLAWIDGDNGIAIFSLRFHELSGVSTVGTNAIGFLDDNQAGRLLKQLHGLPDRVTTVVLMQHYPITRGPDDDMPMPLWPFLPLTEWWNQLKGSKLWAYSFLVNDRGAAGTVLEEIRAMADTNPRRSYLVLFGHRHVRTFGTLGKVILAEAPNVASRDGGFYLGTRGPAGETRISWCPWPREGAIGQ
jgi:predicted MPP superfamily phosphohydrolase